MIMTPYCQDGDSNAANEDSSSVCCKCARAWLQTPSLGCEDETGENGLNGENERDPAAEESSNEEGEGEE
jgi:hypothetical protein